MKKANRPALDPDMLPEYDFTGAVRGKYAQRYAKGVSIRVLKSDTTEPPSSPDRRSQRAKKAWTTRKSAPYRARKTEEAGKSALTAWCESNGWKVLFFEGRRGAPRTGIVDAVVVRINSSDADHLEIKLVQLKSGSGGLTARELTRLKEARDKLSCDWIVAAFDGSTLHLVPDVNGPPIRRKPRAGR